MCVYTWTFEIVLAFMDTIYFIDYCASIVSEFLLLNVHIVPTNFNHVLFMKCVVLYHTSVLCFDHYTCIARNNEIKMSNKSTNPNKHHPFSLVTLQNPLVMGRLMQIDKNLTHTNYPFIWVGCRFEVKITTNTFLQGVVRETCPCRKTVCIRDLPCWRSGGSTTEETRWSVVRCVPEIASKRYTRITADKN